MESSRGRLSGDLTEEMGQFKYMIKAYVTKQKLDRKNNPSCSVNYFNTRHKKHFIFSVVGSTEKQYDYRIKGKYC